MRLLLLMPTLMLCACDERGYATTHRTNEARAMKCTSECAPYPVAWFTPASDGDFRRAPCACGPLQANTETTNARP